MSWSMSEIDGLARKAARGAGFDWGMAEEAGRAVRWLASVGLPGPEALALRLGIGPLAALYVDGAEWRAGAGALCPLTAGAALCDRAHEVVEGSGMVLRGVVQPLLLAPFVAGIAAQTGAPVRLGWAGAAFAFSDQARGRVEGAAALAVDVTVGAGQGGELPPLACALRYDVPPETAAALTALAQRTYAPETDARRIAGAGAGLSDND
ncbi:DUF3726 domain-containing protein [Roseovarius spongiae]|uniref:DUF3726 domain-containing protein n=1 Tax=Roseovarius spongiae TaxID=2320272 RepID=A0A3A8AYL4_9RHOB|nr:DUF3726 domain-containing protein [Roseovarius spongiae]RKF16549.1 DUF3726 domain-containing protein [Roseovarius spongiae]